MKILLSGGGTAGHINPAVAIAKYALEQDKSTEILFVGTKKGLEKNLVPKEGFNIKFVNVDGLDTRLSLKNMISGAKLAFAVTKSIAIMKKFKPDVVVGTGGYVCVSSVIAAKILGIPSVVHEQNVFPGTAVKFLASKCNSTLISFEESRKYLPKNLDIRLTGNPIRPDILKHTSSEAKEKLGISGKKAILVFGGSLGALKINDVMVDFIERNPDIENCVIYFATGKRDFDRVSGKIKERNIKLGENIKVLSYIDNMDLYMNAADLVVSRSGAITLAEICALGKPSVLIPSPNVTNNHQEYNARALSDVGAAITITEREFDVNSLEKAVFGIICDSDLSDKMSEKARKLGIRDACEKIHGIIEEIL